MAATDDELGPPAFVRSVRGRAGDVGSHHAADDGAISSSFASRIDSEFTVNSRAGAGRHFRHGSAGVWLVVASGGRGLRLAVQFQPGDSGTHGEMGGTLARCGFWVAGPSDLWLAVFYLAVPRRCSSALAAAAALAGCAVGRLVRYRLARRCAASCPQRHIALHLRRRRPRRRGAVGTAGRKNAVVRRRPARFAIGGAQSISHYLWSRNITHVDAVVLSHADTDHYNALPELLERFFGRRCLCLASDVQR